MKTTKLSLEALEDRALLSASPLGAIAAPMPEPEAVTVRRWEKLSVPMTEAGQCVVVNKLRGVLNASTDDGDHQADADLYVRFGSRPVHAAPQNGDFAFGYPDISTNMIVVTDHGHLGINPEDQSEGMLLPAVQKVREVANGDTNGHGFQSPFETSSFLESNHETGDRSGTQHQQAADDAASSLGNSMGF